MTTVETDLDKAPVINCLDHGYVRLIDCMGDELRIVNAAKASYQKESKQYGGNEARLLNFLLREGHWSPFRHALVSYEVKAPLMVARQWWKYVVGSDHTMDTAWSEASRRYITMENDYYTPMMHQWRSTPENKRQGSGDVLPTFEGSMLSDALKRHQQEGERLYQWAINEMNVAPEEARLFIPSYGMYVVWRWTASMQAILHFLYQRLAEDAQAEINVYAQAVSDLTQPLFPTLFEAVLNV